MRYGAVQSIFYTAIEDDRTRAVLEEAAAKQIKLVCVSDKVLKKIADTETPQGIIAVCEMRTKRLDDFLASGKMLLVLDRVTDPGNIGTMLRTADAAGVVCPAGRSPGPGARRPSGRLDAGRRGFFHGLAVPPAGAERFERGAVGAGSTQGRL